MGNSFALQRRVGGGFFVFGLCSAYGIRLIYLGATNRIIDSSGMQKAPRWMYIVGGVLMQLPLIAFSL
jgi:hypothetical protein